MCWLPVLCCLAAFSVLSSSCVKEMEEIQQVTGMPVLTAGTAMTRTTLGEDYAVTWDADDALSAFLGNGANLKYGYEGEAGATSGDFAYASGAPTARSYSMNYAVYPYDKNVRMEQAGHVTLDFPAVQQYVKGSFDPKAAIMAAASDGFQMAFQNACGFIELRLYGSATIRSITITGLDGEKIAGPADLWVYDDDVPELEISGDGSATLTLECKTPVTLGTTADTPTTFWIAVPPTYFREGFTITVKDWQGGTFQATADPDAEVRRNTLLSTDPLEVTLEYLNGFEYVEMAPGLKVATKNVGAETPEDIGDYFAWGETSPKEEYINGNYKYGDLYNYEPSKYTLEDGLYELEPEDDAATVNWGEGWHTPSERVFNWLSDSDNYTWTKVARTDADGKEVVGYECVSKVPGFEGNTLFFPVSGYYGNGFNYGSELFLWTSTTGDLYDKVAAFNLCGSGSVFVDYQWYRFCGMPIRPIYGQIPVTEIVIPKESYEIAQDMYLFLEATCVPEYHDPDSIVWSSSDESVATVNEHGVVHALSLGTAVITVAAESSGVSQSCTVTVSQELSISPMGKRWLWDRTDENADFAYIDLNLFNGKYMTYIGLSDPSELTSYTDANIVGSWTCEACCMQANGAIGVTFDKHDGTTTTYLFCHPTETQADLVQVSNFDYEKGINTDYSTSEFCLPATVVTQDVPYAGGLAITLEGTDYPMWSNEEYGVSCFSIFKDDLMDGSSSATLPLAVVRQSNGDLAYGEEADFNDLDLTGKIAVLYRGGGINFITKADRAAAAGASAIIIVNNEEGSINPIMSGMTSGIPYFIIPQAAYDAILDKAEARFITTDEPITDYYLY